MRGPIRSISTILVPVLIAAAIGGYLIGVRRDRASSASPQAPSVRIAPTANVLLTYPSSWRPVSGGPAIPGLALTGSLRLAPNGDPAQAGMLSGRLAAGHAGPLPAQLLALNRGLPRAEVVAFANAQAYRYSRFHLHGYGRTLELYVIPNTGEEMTVLGCYAGSETSSYMRECEQIVAQLTLSGQQRYDLRPDVAYAQQLDALIAALNRERVALRARMRVRDAPEQIGSLAAAVARRFAAAAEAVRQLEPPLAATPAQIVLASSIHRAHHAYEVLASASEHGAGEYDAAIRQVGVAEAGVDTALASYALLGYSSG